MTTDAVSLGDQKPFQMFVGELAEDWEISSGRAEKIVSDYVSMLEKVKIGRMKVQGFDIADDGGREINDASPKLWLDSLLFNHALPTVVRAPNGAGKTYLLSWALMRAAVLHPDWDFYTNVPWFWAANERLREFMMPNFHEVAKMSDILIGSANSVLNDRIPCVGIDEMEEAVDSHSWQDREHKKGAESWRKFTYVKRHLKIRGPLLVYHSWEDIPNYMRKRRVVTDHFRIVIHEGQRYIFSRRTRPYCLVITGQVIPYSKYGWNDFSIDVDMEKLRLAIGKTSQVKVAAQRVLDNINGCIFGRKEGEESKEQEKEEEPDEYETYRCDICGMDFITRWNYETHLKSKGHKQKAVSEDTHTSKDARSRHINNNNAKEEEECRLTW